MKRVTAVLGLMLFLLADRSARRGRRKRSRYPMKHQQVEEVAADRLMHLSFTPLVTFGKPYWTSMAAFARKPKRNSEGK
ncbi:hypothetical protein ACEQPO_18785 [Bacillus sp. SL00103]